MTVGAQQHFCWYFCRFAGPLTNRQNPVMFDFGIKGYQPVWLNGVAETMTSHADRLRTLLGRRLTDTWLVWDESDDEWFADCPVLLDFAGEQIEINHQKFDDLSITWNTVNRATPISWTPTFDLSWRNAPTLTALRGNTLQSLDLLEWTGHDLAAGSAALGFGFADGYLSIYNALDENGLELGPPGPLWRRHPLA